MALIFVAYRVMIVGINLQTHLKGVPMKRNVALAALLFVTVFFLNGCAPVKSLLPLYTDADGFLDANLIGEWRIAPEKSDEQSSSDDDRRWFFEKTRDHMSYECTQFELGRNGSVRSVVTLVRLGDASFADFGPGPSFPEGSQDVSYPRVEAHAIARVWIDKNEIRVRFLDAKWMWEQIHAGKFPLAYVDAPTDTVLTSSTEELRKFVSAHADDMAAFSDAYRLARVN